jgi:hypothetical protein
MRHVFVLLAVAVGCGARTDLAAPDPTSSRGGSGGAGGSDIGVPADGCVADTQNVVLDLPSAPMFTRTVTSLNNSSGYLVGYSAGWPPDDEANMALLSPNVRTLGDAFLFGDEDIVASGNASWTVAWLGNNNDWTINWLKRTGDSFEDVVRGRTACTGCVPGRPATVWQNSELVASAWANFDGDVWVRVDGEAGGTTTTVGRGGTPQLYALGSELLVIHGAEDGTWLREVGFDLSLGREMRLDNLYPRFVETAVVDGQDITLVMRQDETEAVTLHTFDFDSGLGEPREVFRPGWTLIEVDAARAGGRVAFIFKGIEEAQYAVVREDTLELEVGPAHMTDVGGLQGPLHVLSDETGFVFVYGGWDELANYAMYSRRVLCAPL